MLTSNSTFIHLPDASMVCLASSSTACACARVDVRVCVQPFVQAHTVFEIVEQAVDRKTCFVKAGCSTYTLRIDPN